MLFLKRASDLFDQRREELEKEFKEQGIPDAAIETLLKGADQYSGRYFYVPENAHWFKFKHLKENVGTGLNNAKPPAVAGGLRRPHQLSTCGMNSLMTSSPWS